MLPATIAPATKIDRATLLALVDDDKELLRDVVALFLEDGPRTLERLRVGLADRNALQVQIAAHTLAGNAGSFGAADVVTLARNLERKGRDHDLAECGPDLDELEAAVDALCRGLLDFLE
jgi:HPt (histidine-containing phosphotransfer) domain-containing protein